MGDLYSVAEAVGFYARLLFVLLGLRLLYCWPHFDGERPRWLPFKIFQLMCLLGEKQSIEKFTTISEFTKFRYLDSRYQEWKEACVNANKMTRPEYLALEHQTLIEIDYVLQVKSENHFDA